VTGPAPAGNGTQPAPASVGQRLMWLLEQFRGGAGAANCPVVLRLRGPLDEDRLRLGLDRLSARHDSLRTTFSGRGRRLVQEVHDPAPVPLGAVDLGTGTEAGADAVLRAAVEDEVRRPIDAGHRPARYTLWRLGPGDHALCLNLHHLVTDGWSCALLLRDLDLLTRPAEEGPTLPPVAWQYPQFSAWQHEWLARGGGAAAQRYWARQLDGAAVPDIPLRPRPAGAPGLDGASLAEALDAGTTAALGRLARANRTTLPVVMLAIYDLVLRRATGQDDLAVASFLSNRDRAEVRDTVGLVANMVVLRTRLPAGGGLAGALRAVHETVMDAYVHQALPYQLLPADTMDVGARRPDDVMFQLVPQPVGDHTVAGAAVEVMVVDALGSRFECELQLYPGPAGMRAVLFYNRARLDDGWAAGLLADYVGLARRTAAEA
jgi:hypothetical protein